MSTRHKIHPRWVKAPVGIRGNEKTDELVRTVTTDEDIDEVYTEKPTESTGARSWNNRWRTTGSGRYKKSEHLLKRINGRFRTYLIEIEKRSAEEAAYKDNAKYVLLHCRLSAIVGR